MDTPPVTLRPKALLPALSAAHEVNAVSQERSTSKKQGSTAVPSSSIQHSMAQHSTALTVDDSQCCGVGVAGDCGLAQLRLANGLEGAGIGSDGTAVSVGATR